MSVTIRIRRGTATQWEARTTPLLSGEFGYDSTNKIVKIGDGTTLWPSLPTIGTGGNGSNTADFIFTDNEWNSSITLPGDKSMRIEAGADSDLYLTAGDDLYIQTLGTGDDIFIQAADDIRFSAGEETETPHFWRMDSEGKLQLPGDGYISNPADSSGDPSTPYNDTMHLVPDDSIESDQYIILDPTAPNHIHIRAGGNMDNSSADLILGGEKNNVVVSDSARDVFINTRPDMVINTYTNLSEVPGINFIVANTADIGLGYTVNVDGTDYLVDSVEPFDEGSKTVTASGASFTAGQSYTFTYNPEYTNSWEFGSNGFIYGPAEGGLAVLGIRNPSSDSSLFVSAEDKVYLNGANGEFLGDPEVPANQIATLGDIITSYDDLINKPSIINAAPQWTENHSQLEGGANTRYLAGDVVYDSGNIYVANFDNESLPTTNAEYWSLVGPGKRLNIDGRDIANIIWDNILFKPEFFDGNYNNLSNLPNLFSGSYNDLTDTPPLFDGSYNSLSDLPNLFSGSYNDLTDTPSLFDGNYNSLDNLPTLFSGSYNDLTDKPSLFDGNYNSLSNLPTLFSGSYNDLTDKPIIPSLSGYATETYVNNTVSNLVDSAPETLNTLNELAAALGDDPNYATTISTALGNKLDSSTAASTYLTQTNASTTYAPINSPTFTGTVGGISKSMVGLGNVDNTSDIDKPISTAAQTALNDKQNLNITINAQSSNYTITTLDAGKLIEMSGGGTLTVVDSASFPVGFTVNILQTGSSQVTIAGSGFTINATPGLKLRAQWSSATLVKRALNSWVAMGDLSA